MRCGLLYLPTYVPDLDGSVTELYERMLEQIGQAEALGFDSVWLTEHHFDRYGGTIPNPAVFGTAIARQTRRIRIGTAVSVLPLHNPLQVAEEYAMLDVLSRGRLEFGIGRGSVQAEFQEFGISSDDSWSIMTEATELILRAWSGEQFEHAGRHYRYPEIALLPRPIQRPHPPVWVAAARSPETFEWAGRRGFNVMVLPYMYPPEFLQERLDIYRRARHAGGHDPSGGEILAKFHVFVADSTAEAIAQAGESYERYQQISGARSGREQASYWRAGADFERHLAERKIIAGSPTECLELLRYWRDRLGLTHLGGTFHFGGLSQALTLRSIELFAREVAPRLSEPTPQTEAAWLAS